MPFNKINAQLKHYPETSRDAVELGYERSEIPPDDGTNNAGRLVGRIFDTEDCDMTKDSD